MYNFANLKLNLFMKKNEIIKNVEVEKLVFWWKWFARLKSENKDIDWKAIFISWWVLPWSIVNIRVLKSRKDYVEAQCQEVVKKSNLEKKHPNNIYWEQAWSMWVNIPYDEQLKIKKWQIEETIFHLKRLQSGLEINEIVASPIIDWYRNKIEFSFWKYISQKEWKSDQFNVWFHKQWEFSKIEDFDWTILISPLANKIYGEIKKFAKNSWFPAYDQFVQKWFFRHIVIRQTYFTNQIMIIFSINHKYFENESDEEKNWNYFLLDNNWKNKLDFITEFFISLASKYPEIKSIYLSLNNSKSDNAIWELELIYWEKYITETILWLNFNISPKSFFQTNSFWAEKLYLEVLKQVDTNPLKDYTVLDLYWWTWTIWMIFAPNSKKVVSVELVADASRDWMENANKNNIKNIDFINAKVEDFLVDYLEKKENADLLIIDPPRAWMHPSALPNILKFNCKNIIYVSCNPATLSRDLAYILQNSEYKIVSITPVDMFPHTSHIETIVKLALQK